MHTPPRGSGDDVTSSITWLWIRVIEEVPPWYTTCISPWNGGPERPSTLNPNVVFPIAGSMRPPPLTCAPACCGGVVQLTVKLVLAVPPAGTLTFTGFVLVTVQLLATVSVTLRLPAGRPLNVTLPFGTIGWLVALGVPASTVTVKVLGKLEPVVVFDTVRLPVVGAGLSASTVASHVQGVLGAQPEFWES